jgi:hypothetical protein
MKSLGISLARNRELPWYEMDQCADWICLANPNLCTTHPSGRCCRPGLDQVIGSNRRRCLKQE